VLRPVLAILAALVVVAACTSADPGAGSGSPGSSVSRSGDPDQPGSTGAGALPASIIDPIVADAATRLGVDPSLVRIVAAEARTYGDGSLGCPRPGEMYTQAVVDGYQVIVEVNGTQLDYRGSDPGRFRLCEDP
jgi:hypothetical protein